MLIRGQAFRVHGGGTLTRGCMSEREEHSRSQRAAWRALLEQVVRPLEACGTLVEVMVTECSSVRGCPAVMDPIHGLPSLFGSRLVANQTSECESKDQGSNMRTALNMALAAGCCVGGGDRMLITRHDIVFTRPIKRGRESAAPISQSSTSCRCAITIGGRSAASPTRFSPCQPPW